MLRPGNPNSERESTRLHAGRFTNVEKSDRPLRRCPSHAARLVPGIAGQQNVPTNNRRLRRLDNSKGMGARGTESFAGGREALHFTEKGEAYPQSSWQVEMSFPVRRGAA